MKDINFIKTLSVKEQHGLRRWAMFSLTMLGLVLGAITLLQVPQLTTLNEIKKEYAQLTNHINTANTALTHNQDLKNKVCSLDGQCKTIDSLACATQTPHACITHITHACNTNIHMQTCDLKHKKIALTAQCTNVQQATHFVNELKKDTHFSHVQLVSLQPASGNFVTFTIKGLINN